MADIMPQSISSNLAATGQLPSAQPGQRGPLGLLPGLNFAPLIDLQQCGIGSKPMPGIFGSFANGGAYNQKGMGLLQALARSIREDFAKACNGASEYMRFAVADVQPGNFQHGTGAPIGGSRELV